MNCSAGKYNTDGTAACQDCADDFYTDTSGKSICTACPLGYEGSNDVGLRTTTGGVNVSAGATGCADLEPPIITSANTATAINENSGQPQDVYTETATDSSGNAPSLSLETHDGYPHFTFNSTSGVVTLVRDPEADIDSSVAHDVTVRTFTVVATDQVGHETRKVVSLNFTDLDDLQPVITSSETTYANDRWGTWSRDAVYTATAEDDPSDHTSNCCVFSLVDSPAVRIDASTGAVHLVAQPLFTDSPVVFTVKATDGAGNSVTEQVNVNVCQPFHTAESQCTTNVAAAAEASAKSKDAEATPLAAVQFEAVFTSDTSIAEAQSKDFKTTLEAQLAAKVGVPASAVTVDVRATVLRRHLSNSRRLVSTTYELDGTVETFEGDAPGLVDSILTPSTLIETIAETSGLAVEDVALLDVQSSVAAHPAFRASTYHGGYKRVAKVFRQLAFPIPEGLSMTGEGGQDGALATTYGGTPLSVKVINLPAVGVHGCQPLVSFYTQVRDKLISTLPYAIKQYETNAGSQSELERIRTDIETAQRDAHSVSVFCGDLGRILKIRREVYNAYTSAWADMNMGSGKLAKFRHGTSLLNQKHKARKLLSAFKQTHGDIVRHAVHSSEHAVEVVIELLK